jgi:polyisoprenoid-binding protein YceI
MILRSLSLSIVLAISACSDPAQNAPAAQVRDPAPTPEPTSGGTTLNIDRSRSSVGFTGAKVTASHDGTFSNFSGTIGLDPQGNIENSSVNVTIQIGSVQIEPQRLHDHLLTFMPAPSSRSTGVISGSSIPVCPTI